MADTFATLNARIAKLQRELTDDALLHDIGKMAKEEARKAASADLGGDDKFSGWTPKLDTRYDIVGEGKVLLKPTPKSAGPWRVAQEGRNRGNASGFAGPGINRKTGLTARTKSGGIRKQRARAAKRWNGVTPAFYTADDAIKAIDKKVPKLVESRIGRAIRRSF